MTAVVDDHLLRDLLAGEAPAELVELASGEYATTNLYYYRLCRSAATPREGRLLRGWSGDQRSALMANLVALPDDITILPLRDLAWRMAAIGGANERLSTLGAEALAAAEQLAASLCVAAEDDGPGIRAGARNLGVAYRPIAR